MTPLDADKLEGDNERLHQVLKEGDRSTMDKHITAEFTGVFHCRPSCTSPKRLALEIEQVDKLEVVWKNLKPHLPEK